MRGWIQALVTAAATLVVSFLMVAAPSQALAATPPALCASTDACTTAHRESCHDPRALHARDDASPITLSDGATAEAEAPIGPQPHSVAQAVKCESENAASNGHGQEGQKRFQKNIASANVAALLPAGPSPIVEQPPYGLASAPLASTTTPGKDVPRRPDRPPQTR